MDCVLQKEILYNKQPENKCLKIISFEYDDDKTRDRIEKKIIRTPQEITKNNMESQKIQIKLLFARKYKTAADFRLFRGPEHLNVSKSKTES